MTDDEYSTYHEWRSNGPSAEFVERMKPYDEHVFIRMARAVRAVQIGRSAERGR